MDKKLFELVFSNYKVVFKEYFNSSVNINEKDALEYSFDNTVKALEELILNGNYDFFTRTNNTRENMIEYGINKVKKELIKYIVYYCDYYKTNDSDKVKALNYNYNEIDNMNDVVVSLYYNLIKNGVENMQGIFNNKHVVHYLVKSYMDEMINNEKIDVFDHVDYEENEFLITSINSYFASNL